MSCNLHGCEEAMWVLRHSQDSTMLGCRILQASTLYMHAPCNQKILRVPSSVTGKKTRVKPFLSTVWNTRQLVRLLSQTSLLCAQMAALTHPVVSQAEKYWRQPFVPVVNSRQLAEFVVLDVDVVGRPNGRYVLADVQVRMTHITAMRQSVM